MTESRVREILEKLRVASGLRGKSLALDDAWRLGFFYDREQKAFVLDLSFHGRTQRVRLGDGDVESRGRSNWMADKTWRLTKQAIDRISPDIVKAVERAEAKRTSHDLSSRARLKSRRDGADRKAVARKTVARRGKRDPKSLARLQSELMYAQQDYKFWARQEHRLTRDEYAQKMQADRRVRELQAAIERQKTL